MKKVVRRSNIQPGGRHVQSPESRRYIDYGGWKLHIAVHPDNYELVDKWLDRNHPGQYKHLHGGERGESDFTIYIGNKDDTVMLANKMLREIGRYLEPVNRGTDMKFNEKVAGRFDPRGEKNAYVGKPGFMSTNPHVVHYGRNGLPYDSHAADIRMQLHYEAMHKENPKYGKFNPEKFAKWEEELRDHETFLRKDLAKKYGTQYTGTGENLFLRKKKKSIKPKIKRKVCSCKKK